jgi:tetratricopeptide (TPR) repeat protein
MWGIAMTRLLFGVCMALMLAIAPAVADETTGDAKFKQGNYLGAAHEYDDAVLHHPDDVELLIKACRAFAVSGEQLDNGLADCQRAIQRDGFNASAHNVRGLIYYRMGRFDDALKDYDISLARRPNHAGSLYMRGLTYLKLGQEARGQTDINAAIRLDITIDRQLAAYGIRR